MSAPAQPPARPPHVIPLLAALIAAGAILVAVYPGFMSYDSLHALREARGAVGGGPYPPFVSYVWRALDAIWPGPALMLFAQNFLLVLTYATILSALGYRAARIAIGVFLFCVIPPILGPMLVVWKDIGVSACLCAGVACLLLAQRGPHRVLAIAAGILMLFCGAAYRLNAISAVLPLVIWLALEGGFLGWSRAKSIAAGLTFLAAIALGVTVVNHYRFPDFEPLPPIGAFETNMIFDLVAMSASTGKDLMPYPGQALPADDTIDYFRRIYDPRHNEITAARDTEGRLKQYFHVPSSRVHSAFFAAVVDEPWAYIRRRTSVFRELVGLVRGPTFVATHPGIDENEFGITYEPSRLSKALLYYIESASRKFFGKPWFYYLLGTMAVAVAIAKAPSVRRNAAIAVYASGALYLFPLFFISPAADVRYNHWSIVCMFIVMALAAAPPRSCPQRTAPA